MLNSKKLSEAARYDVGVAPQDITTDRTGSWYDAAGFRRFLAFLSTATVAAGNSATVQFQQAEDSSGTNAKDLGTATSVTAGSGGEELSAIAEAKAEDMDAGFTHIAVKVTCEGSGVNGSATLVRGVPRYNP
jgi:hypothetical protein